MSKSTKAFLDVSALSFDLEERLGNPIRFRVSFPSVNPTPSTPATTAAKVRRKVFCRHYGLCLDRAIDEEWASFSCSQCSDFTIEQEDASYWLDQGENAGQFLNMLFFQKPAPRNGSTAQRKSRKERPRIKRNPPPRGFVSRVSFEDIFGLGTYF